MNTKILKTIKSLFITLALGLSMQSQAGLITADFDTADVSAGDLLTVELTGSGFAETDNFWFDFLFDNSIFEYQADSLTSDLNIVDTAAGAFDGLEVTNFSGGLDFTFLDFTTTVSGTFSIAKFQLKALTDGFSNFSLADIDGFNVDGSLANFSASFSRGDRVEVTATAVSEPNTVILLLLSVSGLLLLSRRS